MEEDGLQNNPRAFDIGKKGFLSYEEYRGYCLSILKQPLARKKTGNRIQYDDIEFGSCGVEIDGIFDFLSAGEDHISLATLEKAVSRLEMNISGEDMAAMINMFDSNGLISRELFSKSFG
ncbi:hypothetical protein M970_050730 [Encephalitozoon cuniculi EcunIII-L]|uniref:Ca binding protein n=1 Tax=Encephalitozoon cuniculi TaxID=6035 RepID=M1K3P5_ENCCN|nr:ca binding protein [Encephalitozoon cuniculi]KMV66131.1 hypothetical protein M970_050730 [Encephalitozoon cuniculi EcunIII-L]UYI27867.1 hypothetical protein J0A71_08g17550 [Encephalitozoon cuniculi]